MKIEREKLIEIISQCTTRQECFELLGLDRTATHSYRVFNHYVKLYEININHLVIKKPNNRITTKSLKSILAGHCPFYKSSDLKHRLIREGIFKWECSSCELSEWMNNPIPLELDHINGISTDHRLENIRLLCRNCHGLTPTFAGRNVNNMDTKKAKRHHQVIQNKKDRLDKIQEYVTLIIDSNIDFNKFGWVTQVSMVLKISPQKVNQWMKKWMPEFYNTRCFKKRKPIN